MFRIGHQDGPRPKCYFTHSVLPASVDHDQPSQNKRPFSTIQEYPYIHTLDLLLPHEIHDATLDKLSDKGALQYAKVHMKLSDIVEGDFFNDYIKTGNILMLSEGRHGIDSIFSLREGILRLELDRATYERTGLNGTAIPNGGRKHVKVRYAVEINLRLPSMVRGKHGFERILWAFKNVLNSRVAWLFYDLKGLNNGNGPIAAHQPILRQTQSRPEAVGEVTVPFMPEEIDSGDQETPTELLEWLTLAMGQSPRIRQDDDIDEYLSRYRIPKIDGNSQASAQKLMKVQWHGFIPPSFVQIIVTTAIKAAGKTWFALSSRAFDGKTHTFLQYKQHTLSWEFED